MRGEEGGEGGRLAHPAMQHGGERGLSITFFDLSPPRPCFPPLSQVTA